MAFNKTEMLSRHRIKDGKTLSQENYQHLNHYLLEVIPCALTKGHFVLPDTLFHAIFSLLALIANLTPFLLFFFNLYMKFGVNDSGFIAQISFQFFPRLKTLSVMFSIFVNNHAFGCFPLTKSSFLLQ